MSQANMDLGIFQETKITNDVYTHRSDGYNVAATDAPIRHRGGVAVFYCPPPHFAVEAIHKFGPNVVGFQMATGERQWYIVGCHLAPDDTSTIDILFASIKEQPWGTELTVAGDLNVQLSDPEGDQREQEIAAVPTTEGLEDMSAHFLPCRSSWCRECRTWSMLLAGREVRYRIDYIIGTDLRLF